MPSLQTALNRSTSTAVFPIFFGKFIRDDDLISRSEQLVRCCQPDNTGRRCQCVDVQATPRS